MNMGAQQATDQPYPRFGEPVNQFGGCTVDGVPAPCGYVVGLVNMGAGVQVFTRRTTQVRNGRVEVLTAFTDYHYGFVPMGATSDGNGDYSFGHNGGPPTWRDNHPHDGGPGNRNPFGVGMDERAGSLEYNTSGFFNRRQQTALQNNELTPLNILAKRHAFGDADTVLSLDKDCRDFFTKGRSLGEVRNILGTLGRTVGYNPNLPARAATANSGAGANARITLSSYFFSNDASEMGYYYSPTTNRYEHREYALTPRQFRAFTVLHELAHALGLIPHDRHSIDKTGAQSEKNDDTINDKCGIGLGDLPVND